MAFTQPSAAHLCGAMLADSAKPRIQAHVLQDRCRGSNEFCPGNLALLGVPPMPHVAGAEPGSFCDAVAVVDLALPPEDRVPRRKFDQICAEQRVETRCGEQRGQQFQAVPFDAAAFLVGQQGQQRDHC